MKAAQEQQYHQIQQFQAAGNNDIKTPASDTINTHMDTNTNYLDGEDGGTEPCGASFVEYIVDVNIKLCTLLAYSAEYKISDAERIYNELLLQETPLRYVRECMIAMASVYYEYGDYEKSMDLFTNLNASTSMNRDRGWEKSTIFSEKGLDFYSSLLWQVKDQRELLHLYWETKSQEAQSNAELYIILANVYSLARQHKLAVVSLYYALQVIDIGMVRDKIDGLTEDLDYYTNSGINDGGNSEAELGLDMQVLAGAVLGYTNKVIRRCESVEGLRQAGYIYSLLGYEFTNVGELEHAISSFTASIRVYKYGYNAQYGLGMIYLRAEKLELAHYFLDGAYKLNSNNPMVNCSLAMVFEKQKYYITAYEYYKRAIVKAEPWVVATDFGAQVGGNGFVRFVLFKIANLYFKQCSFAKCQKILMNLLVTKTTTVNSGGGSFGINNDEILFLLGRTLTNLGKHAAAKMCLEESISYYTSSNSGSIGELSLFVRNIRTAISGFANDMQSIRVETGPADNKANSSTSTGDSLNQDKKGMQLLTAHVIKNIFT